MQKNVWDFLYCNFSAVLKNMIICVKIPFNYLPLTELSGQGNQNTLLEGNVNNSYRCVNDREKIHFSNLFLN